MKVFCRLPPAELLLRIFRAVGVTSFIDEKILLLNHDTFNVLDEIFTEVEPYYKPHKRFMIRRCMDRRHYMQVIRNLCKVHGLFLYSKEDSTKRKLIYRVLNPENHDTAFYHILLREANRQIPESKFEISFADT
jgi:hypothetical protein